MVDLLSFFLDLLAHELGQNRFNENLLRSCAWGFDPRTQLHKNYYQLKQEHLDRYRTETEAEAWRRNLVVGAFVDVRVKIDLSRDTNTSHGWIRGRIIKVSACEADMNLLSVGDKDKIVERMKA